MKAKPVMWCSRCGVWFPIREQGYRNVCPRCGHYLERWKCIRCGHEWVPRNTSRPAEVCPRCNSKYWNRMRQNERRKEE